MKKILVLLLFFSISIYSQDKDSLLNIVKSSKVFDTLHCNRLSTLIDLEPDAKVWMKYNDQLGKITGLKLKQKLTKIDKKTYLNYYGLYFNNIGYYYSYNQDYDQSIKNYIKAAEIQLKSNNLKEYAITIQNIGNAYMRKGEPQNVIKYFNEALSIYKKINYSIGLANVNDDLGGVYADNGSQTKALEFYTKSLKISDLIKDEPSKIRTLTYMTRTLIKQKEYDKALEYLFIIEKYHELKSKDFAALQTTYHNYANTYKRLGDIKKMFFYTNKSIIISEKNNLKQGLINSYGLLSSHYLKQKNIEKAFYYSKLRIELSKNDIVEPTYTQTLIQHSNLLNLKKDFNQAKLIGIVAYERAKKLNNLEVLISATNNLREIFKNIGDQTNTLKYAELEINLKDSLSNINTQNSAIKSLFAYETEKKDNELFKINQAKTITEIENKRQKTTLYFLIFGIFSALITGFLLFKRFKTKKKNELLKVQLIESKKTLEAEKNAAQSELKALKSQMNPHFIFNALNSIQEQFMFGDKLIANEQMGNFTTLTREILTVSGKKKITIQREIDILTKYLELEKMRFDKDFSYDFIVSDEIDEDYDQIPPMILQPFVENSIKHGLLHQSGAKKINIYFDIDSNRENILCIVEDNGIGLKKSATIKVKNAHVSFSTKSIKQRLDILNKNKPERKMVVYEDIFDENGICAGTKVTLTIPIV